MIKKILAVFVLAPIVACSAPDSEEDVEGYAATGTPAEKHAEAKVAPLGYYGKIGRRLASMMTQYHVLQHDFDDDISARAWTNLVTYYDFDHSVFLKSDLEKFAEREKSLDDEIKSGDVSFGYDVYRLYCERLAERVDFATNLLARAEWDFQTNENYRIKRKDAPWPATREEAEAHWTKRLKNEVLAQIITRELDAEGKTKSPETERPDEAADGDVDSETDPKLTPEENLVKKYRQYLAVLTEPDEESILQTYFSALARAYDPHSDYLSPTSKEEFDMDMNLTLCGVGAVLSMDDGALKIAEVMPGGPVDRDGRIQEGDKIVGVRQGDGEMEDIMWQPMKKSIRKIRGAKGTRVTLEIVPRSDPTGTTKKLIELVRDEIKLEDQAATGRVETVESPAGKLKLGYVFLPGFYGTMDKKFDDPDFRSSALDVGRYVAEFNATGVDGLVLDLRGDGGGSLREAVMLSALFVPEGPVVQIRDTRSVGSLPIPRGNPVAFRKPMVVLVDRASASASEIVAGHLRDTGRAIVLGDYSTHGKGTVQTVMGMGPEKYGSMKITTARFYRIDGRSTQMRGVESDIHLPSLLDSLDIGETNLTYALPFTRIRKDDYVKCWDLDTKIDDLKALSEKRLAGNERWLKHLENVGAMRELADREEVPLEREARKAMMKEDREIRELDEEGAKDEAKDGNAKDKDDSKKKRSHRRRSNQPKEDDVVLDEAFEILGDLIRLKGGEELVVPEATGWLENVFGI